MFLGVSNRFHRQRLNQTACYSLQKDPGDQGDIKNLELSSDDPGEQGSNKSGGKVFCVTLARIGAGRGRRIADRPTTTKRKIVSTRHLHQGLGPGEEFAASKSTPYQPQ